jgi:ABC-type bacteriocin/lantibiotic exporter with double-glycine peptidase domain
VPFFPQQKNGCGASSLAMILQYWNSVPAVDPQSIFAQLYSDKLKGIAASRMKTYLEQKGFRAFTFSGTLPDLKEHLLKGRPLIVSLGGSTLHYVVVVGLDERQKLVLVNDPAVKKLSRMNQDEFLAAWNQTNCWTLLAVPDARP